MERYEENGFIFSLSSKKAILAGIKHDEKKLQGEDIEIPFKVKGVPVTKIGSRAFCGLKIRSVLIPNSITMINTAAFKDCDELIEINHYYTDSKYSSKWLIVSDYAFKNCRRLEDVNFEREISYLGTEAFAGCSNLSRISANFKKIRRFAFYNCAFLKHIILSDGAYLYGESIQKSGIKLINVWGEMHTTKAETEYIIKNNIELCCDPQSNCVDLAYLGANITSLF